MGDIEKRFEREHKRNIAAALHKVELLTQQSYDQLARELAKYDIRNPQAFSWAKYKKLEGRIDLELGSLYTKTDKVIRYAMIVAWNTSTQKNDMIVNQYLKNISWQYADNKTYFNKNIAALKAYVNRATNGMTLSDRVWKITNEDTKDALKTYLGEGIATGKSATQISRDVRNVLRDPETRFRRINKDGKLTLSKVAKAFHPGQGVYRSSYKNALRLTATETNMAYRRADYERWQQLDFVIGYEVHLSGSHPRLDICDTLRGEYPKDFIFTGWHPWCLCFTTSKLMSGSQFKRIVEQGIEPKNQVRYIPNRATKWFIGNKDSLDRLKSKPYFITDNTTFFVKV
jgi:hypothetical protein